MLSQSSAILAQADEACISKLASEKFKFPELILAPLLSLEQDAPTAWYLRAIKKEPACRQLMRLFMHMALKDKFETKVLERLFRGIGAEWLRQPFGLMALAPRAPKLRSIASR